MECGVLLNMRRALQLFILLCLASQACAASHTSCWSYAQQQSLRPRSLTVRKLFLGLPVLVEGGLLHPVRNRSDAELDPIFLQQIVAMSQSAYDRQILIGVNRQGWLRPAEVSTVSRVLDILYDDPNAVTFMWLHEVAHNPRVRVLRVLWSD